MTLICWNGSLSLGIELVDKQHEHLVHIVNALNDAMLAEMADTVLGPMLVELIACTVAHFKYEEQLLRTYNYAQMASHIAKHTHLTNQISDIQVQFDSGSSVIDVELMGFLRTWLSKHIQESDKHFVPFLRSHRIS